jgi:hypothetical protein
MVCATSDKNNIFCKFVLSYVLKDRFWDYFLNLGKPWFGQSFFDGRKTEVLTQSNVKMLLKIHSINRYW